MVETQSARPRIEGAREREILDAAVDVLLDVGYDKLTFDLVATRAHAGKATLYRKWPTKPNLVMAALVNSKACHMPVGALPDAGCLADDLRALNSRKDVRDSRAADVFAAVSPALSRDEELRQQFLTHFSQPRIDRFGDLLARAQTRGEIGPHIDVDMLKHVVPALAVHHSIVHGGPPSQDEMTRIIEKVLLPAAGVVDPNHTTA